MPRRLFGIPGCGLGRLFAFDCNPGRTAIDLCYFEAWFKKRCFRITPKIDGATLAKGFRVSSVTLILTTPLFRYTAGRGTPRTKRQRMRALRVQKGRNASPATSCDAAGLTFRRSLVEFPRNFPGVRRREVGQFAPAEDQEQSQNIPSREPI